MTLNNLTDTRITETELTGSYFERPCPCGVEDCDCLQSHLENQDDIEDGDRDFERMENRP